MRYDTAELEELSVKAIKENELTFVDDIIPFLPCARSTFYSHNLDKSDAIKNELFKTKINTKRKLRKKWEESSSAALQIALYKLLATDEERAILDKQAIDVNVRDPEKDYKKAKEALELLTEDE